MVLDTPKTRLGFPEVTLGLLPGAGGVVRSVGEAVGGMAWPTIRVAISLVRYSVGLSRARFTAHCASKAASRAGATASSRLRSGASSTGVTHSPSRPESWRRCSPVWCTTRCTPVTGSPRPR